MYYIGICDDYQICRREIRKFCDDYFQEKDIEYTCVEFASGTEVLEYEGEKLNLLFLDVEMPDMNGIDVVRQLEMVDTVWRVVFVTFYDYMSDAFGLKTLGYISKPAKYEKYEEYLDIMIKEHELNVIWKIELDGIPHMVETEDIIYLEAAKNYVYIKLKSKDKKMLLTGNIKVWEEKFAMTTVIRVHKSKIVNLMHVFKISDDKIVMKNGEEFKIGRAYRKTVKDKYDRYLLRRDLNNIWTDKIYRIL